MKKGFTIAEVLITLAVIGVIATTALPALKAKVEQNKRNALLRATVTQFNEAYRLAAYDLGYDPRCGYWGSSGNRPDKYRDGNTKTEYDSNGNPSWWYKDDNGNWQRYGDDANGQFGDCKAFGEAVTARLGVAKACKNGCYAAGIIPKYEGNDTISFISFKNAGKFDGLEEGSEEYNKAVSKALNEATGGMGGFRQSNILNNNSMHVLEDGKIIVGYMGATGYFHPRIFAIDINGVAGPNRWGEDLFAFSSKYTEDGQTIELEFSTNYKERDVASVSEAYSGRIDR